MDVARASATFATETLTPPFILEVGPLLRAHYEEVAHYQDIPLDPDWDTYLKIQEAGALRVYTARAEDHLLIGYSQFFIKPHLHYKSCLVASNDVIFIDQSRRGFGRKFIAWCDEQLKAEGVQVVTHHVKLAHDWSGILERDGYEAQDKIMTRRLDR